MNVQCSMSSLDQLLKVLISSKLYACIYSLEAQPSSPVVDEEVHAAQRPAVCLESQSRTWLMVAANADGASELRDLLSWTAHAIILTSFISRKL